MAASAELAASAQADTIDFETSGAAGSVPLFTQAITGKGSPADWKLVDAAGAPSGKSGKFGLWTKADSVIQFDDLTIEETK